MKLKEHEKMKAKRASEVKKRNEAKKGRQEAIQNKQFEVYSSKKEEAKELK
jgi:hypothetical protein